MLTYEGRNDFVVVRPDDPVTERASGILIVDRKEEKRPDRGVVLSTGLGRVTKKGIRVPPDVKPGDHVVFSKYGANRIDDLVFVLSHQIYGVLED